MYITKLFIVFISFFFFNFLECGLKAQEDWSKLEYYFNAGSLPSPYHYSYKIIINYDGIGVLIYTKGYESTGKNVSKYTFELEKEKLENLKNSIKESNILNLNIKTRSNEAIPDGGHINGLRIYGKIKENDSKEHILLKDIPVYYELEYSQILERLYKDIRNSVPEKIWNEVNSIKEN